MHTAAVPPTIRPFEPADVEAGLALLALTFGQPHRPEDRAAEGDVVDPRRFYAVDDDGQLVGVAGSFAFSMTVPGGPVPVAGVTWVGVHPSARRRGVLSALMRRQLDDLHDAGEAVAALWASEGGIYQRYGYAPAAWNLQVSLPHGAAFLQPVARGGVRLVAPTADVLAPIYDPVAAVSPGWPDRDAAWWRYRLHDPEHARGDGTALQAAVTEGGYVLYRQRPVWTDGSASGVVEVREVAAADPAARARLWRFVLDLDLTAEVTMSSVAVDDELWQLLAEPRRARARLSENVWVRLVDVPAALAQRRYACDVDVVLQVADDLCPWNTGTFRLVGGRDGADCTRLDDGAAPDLSLHAADLGAAYLGGTTLRSRRATVSEHTPGALSRTSTAFGPIDRAPCCPMVF